MALPHGVGYDIVEVPGVNAELPQAHFLTLRTPCTVNLDGIHMVSE